MKTERRFGPARATLCVALLAGSVASQAAEMFNDARYVNVLREFSFNSTTNLVSGTGWANAALTLDGSGTNDNAFLGGAPGTVTRDYILGGTRTVSRLDLDFEATFDSPATMEVRGSTDGGLTYPILLATYTPNPNDPFISATFTPTAVNAVRTISTQTISAFGNYYNRVTEARLYLDTSVSQPMYGDYAGAFNYLTDLWNAGKIAASGSPNNAVWDGLSAGGIANLFNADMNINNGISDDPDGAGQRSYALMTLNQAYQMNYATLGSDDDGIIWGGTTYGAGKTVEFYTYNGTPLDPSVLSGTTVTDLTGQGWILQGSWTGDNTVSKSFLLPKPGLYNQMLLVMDDGGGRLTNFELFAAMPEPGSLLLVALGGLALAGCRRRG
jgi:hypothetical protein